jgi:hypothetical protein
MDPMAVIVIAAMVGGWAWIQTKPRRQRERLQREIEEHAAATGDEPEGSFVRITGVALRDMTIPGKVLRGPLSDQRCLWFECTLGSQQERSDRRFVLAHERGRYLVDVTHVRVALEPLPAGDLYSLRALQFRSDNRDHDGTSLPISETIIRQDERITVAGILAREPIPTSHERGYRDGQATRLVLAGTAERPVLIGPG